MSSIVHHWMAYTTANLENLSTHVRKYLLCLDLLNKFVVNGLLNISPVHEGTGV